MDTISRKITILDAATKIVAEKGIFYLTLDAVAEEAGISKGGLLYHFRSKEVLVERMVEHVLRNYKDKIESHAAKDLEEKGKRTRAYLDAIFKNANENEEMHAGLLAAKTVNPSILNQIHEVSMEWQHAIENDGLDPVMATIIRLATDGIWLADLFDINPIDREQKELIYNRLKKWSHDY